MTDPTKAGGLRRRGVAGGSALVTSVFLPALLSFANSAVGTCESSQAITFTKNSATRPKPALTL